MNTLFDIHDHIPSINGTELRFVVLGRPQQCGSKLPMKTKDGRWFVSDSNDQKRLPWMQEVKSVAYAAMREQGIAKLIDAPVSIEVQFHFKRPQVHFCTGKNAGVLSKSAPKHHVKSPDLDKLQRCLGDAMTGVVYTDDRLIWSWNASRHWTTEVERTEVTLRVE